MAEPTAPTRLALRTAFHINVRSIAPIRGLITAIPVVALFAIGLALHNPRTALTMGIGANLVAVVSLVGAPQIPLRLAVLDAVGMGVSVALASATGSLPWLHATLLALLCFAAGMAVIFGQTQASLGTQAIIAYLALGRFSGSPLAALHSGLLVTLGAAVEITALLILRLPPTLRYQRSVVADALLNLSRFATSGAESSGIDTLSSIDAAQRVLSPLSLLGQSEDRDLSAVVDSARRARLDLTTLAGLRARVNTLAPQLLDKVHETLAAVGDGLHELSLAVRRPKHPEAWHESTEQIQRSLDGLQTHVHSGELSSAVQTLMVQILAHLEALQTQVRSIGDLVERENSAVRQGPWRLDVRWGGLERSRRGDNLSLLRENLRWDSTAFRHAVRLVIAVIIATIVAQVFHLPRGYWIAFAVAVILKPDYSTLLRIGVGRIVGTLAGATLAAVVVSELHPSYFVMCVLVGFIAAVAYATWTASFSVSIGLITALVLLMLSVTSSNSIGTALDRLIDIVVGALISAGTYLIWPSSPAQDVLRAESSLFSALARYLDEVLKVVVGAEAVNDAVSGSSRTAHLRFALAETAVGRSLAEPVATRGDANVQRGLLTCALRILRATHALRFEAERGATMAPSLAINQLGRTLVAALDNLGEERSTQHADAARLALRDAEVDLTRAEVPTSISLNLDELVDAVTTASHLIASEDPAGSGE